VAIDFLVLHKRKSFIQVWDDEMMTIFIFGSTITLKNIHLTAEW